MNRPLPILTYHYVGDHLNQREHRSIFCHAPVFAAQMRLLHRLGWRTMPLSDAARLADANEPIPRRHFVLTFDDGDADLDWAVRPILTELGYSATVFIVSGHVGGIAEWESSPVLRDRRLLNAKQIGAMATEGWDVGGHTIHHADLVNVEAAEAVREIEGCKRDLETLVGRPVTSFCYPSGCVTPPVRDAVQAAGFALSVTTRKGCVRPGDDPYMLPRVSVSHRAGPVGLLWRIQSARRNS